MRTIIICLVLLGVLAGLFLKWQVFVSILILQIVLMGVFLFHDNQIDHRIVRGIAYTIPAFHLPAWALYYIMTIPRTKILDILFSVIFSVIN